MWWKAEAKSGTSQSCAAAWPLLSQSIFWQQSGSDRRSPFPLPSSACQPAQIETCFIVFHVLSLDFYDFDCARDQKRAHRGIIAQWRRRIESCCRTNVRVQYFVRAKREKKKKKKAYPWGASDQRPPWTGAAPRDDSLRPRAPHAFVCLCVAPQTHSRLSRRRAPLW